MYFNEKQIIFDYLNGESTKSIAKKLNTYNTSIRRVLLRNNINLRNCSESQTNRPNIFEDLTKEEVQYWLGILASDGTIGKKNFLIALEFKESDLNHLIKYCNFTYSSYKKITYKKYNCYCYRSSFKNKKINLYLKNLGITNNKSKTIKINFKFNEHFIRGVFDGDGTTSIRKNSKLGEYRIFTASENFKNQISDFLKEKDIKHTVSKSKNNLFTVSVFKQSEVKKFYDMIYNNATVFLERKKAVICPLYEEIQSDAKSSNSVN